MFSNMHTHDLGFNSVLEVKKFHKDAVIPTRGSYGAAGHDLYSVEDVVIPPNSLKLVNTGIGVRLPMGCYFRVAPRSGLSMKGIDVLAGVVDSDWRDAVKVVMINHMNTEYVVSKGDRVAQGILERIIIPIVREVQELDDTNRGSNGFGSTGK